MSRIEDTIFQPPPASYDDTLPGLFRVIAGGGTSLAALFLPNPVAGRTLFYLHGNGEDMGQNLDRFVAFHNAGYAVLAFDYRSYGLSGGTPSEKNVYSDTADVIAEAQRRFGFTNNQTLIIGRSVGSGPAVDLAATQRMAGLVLISPLASALRVVTRVKILPFDYFDNLAKARHVKCPSLVIHGTADKVIRVQAADKLSKKLPQPVRYIRMEGADHGNIFESGQVLEQVRAFAQTLPA